jgi:branched-subunit amino acid ABC-type transport system permease component
LGEATSASDGTFIIDLPGPAIDHLGKSFKVLLDAETVPEGSEPEVTSRTITINLDADQSVTFPVGAVTATTGKLAEALQLALGSLVFSVVLAMSALGLSMIFGTTGLTNFAHGELITFGALVAFAVDRLPGAIEIGGANITIIVAVIAAFMVSGAFGWLNDAALWAPLRHRGTGLVAMMIVSIGLSVFLRNVYQYFAGAQSQNYSQYSAVTPWELGPVLLTPKELVVILGGMAVLVAATSLLQFTRLGKATRAVADNPGLASATGINVEWVIRLVWIGGAALAGLSGALLGLTQGFDYQIGFKILLLVFAAVVLGGLGTIWGAIIGAFFIGLFTELTTLFVSAEFKYVGALLVLIVVLLIRPQGLLGKAQRVG